MKKTNYFLAFVILLIIFSLFLFSPIFFIKEFNISKMERYSETELLQKLNWKISDHMLKINIGKAKKTLLKDPYFKKVAIKRRFPSMLDIIVEERLVVGYVPYDGSYLFVDSKGVVLESGTVLKKNIPVLIGLNFQQFSIGQAIAFNNPEAFPLAVFLSNQIRSLSLQADYIRIDVEKIQDIRLFFNEIEVLLGDEDEMVQKLLIVKQVLEQLPANARGKLFLNEQQGKYRFQYLT